TVFDRLLLALQSDDANVRSAAALALKDMGQATAADVEPLRAALLAKAPTPDARRYAAAALGEIGPPARSAVPELTAALKDADAPLRPLAARALGKIGADAGPAVPAIIEMLSAEQGEPAM